MKVRSLWRVIHVRGDELESVLNSLAGEDCKIFSVQYTGSQWVVITEKIQKDEPGEVTMGFGSKH